MEAPGPGVGTAENPHRACLVGYCYNTVGTLFFTLHEGWEAAAALPSVYTATHASEPVFVKEVDTRYVQVRQSAVAGGGDFKDHRQLHWLATFLWPDGPPDTIFLVFHASQRWSFEFVPKWYESQLEGAQKYGHKPAKFVVCCVVGRIGNELPKPRVVSHEEGQEIADSLHLGYVEVCPETGQGFGEFWDIASSSEYISRHVRKIVQLVLCAQRFSQESALFCLPRDVMVEIAKRVWSSRWSPGLWTLELPQKKEKCSIL